MSAEKINELEQRLVEHLALDFGNLRCGNVLESVCGTQWLVVKTPYQFRPWFDKKGKFGLVDISDGRFDSRLELVEDFNTLRDYVKAKGYKLVIK